MNPSTEEILKAYESLPTDRIIVLPNNKNIVMTARQTIDLTTKRVAIVPSESVPQGIAAMLALSPDGDFEALLKAKFPSSYQLSLKNDEAGHPIGILEAIENGVTFTSLVHSATADSIAILRPKLTKAEKAQAILRAFSYAGRPYDYNFDFLTDSALVCSELVFKCYEPSNGFKGVTFPQSIVMGRVLTSPNELAMQFDAEGGSQKAQTRMVAFLDGYEDQKKAVESDEKTFRESWKRPKWHILVQGEAQKK